MCKREYLNYLRVREWQDFESQLRQVCKELKVDLGRRPARRRSPTPTASTRRCCPGCSPTSACSRSATAGLERLGRRRPRGPREYLGARGTRFAIFPGSALRGKNPAYLMAGELVETGRLWARQNAAIKPEWAERIGAHLVKRSYSEPHWSKKRAAVMAYERVTLYGVPLVTDRLVAVRQGRPRAEPRAVHPARARVRRVVTAGTGSSPSNQRLLEEAEELEHRARRRDIVVDEHTLFDFYDARVGRRGRQRRALRPVVEAGAADASPTCSPSTRRCSPTTPPRRCARTTSPRPGSGRGPDLPDQLPLRAGRGRRRAHHRRAGRDPQPGRRRRLLVERPRRARTSWSPA